MRTSSTRVTGRRLDCDCGAAVVSRTVFLIQTVAFDTQARVVL